MSRNRKYFTRNRGYKRSWKKKRFERSVARIAKKACVKEAELKVIDTDINETDAYVGNSTLTLLTGVALGDNYTDREGVKIKLNSINCNLRVTDIESANAIGDVYVRIMIVLVRETDGADPAITDILEVDHPTSQRNWLLKDKFIVISDKRFVLPKHDTVSHTSKRIYKYYRKFKPWGINTTFKDTTALVASTQSNHLYLVLMNDAANTDDPPYYGEVRVTYTDV